MNEKEFLEKLADVLNADTDLAMDMKLDSLDCWDSLGALAFMGMCFEVSDNGIMHEKVRTAETIRDLYELL